MTPQPARQGRPPVELSCAHCAASFVVAATREGTAKYCSRACLSAAGRTTVICQHCGTGFSRKKADAEARLFCSRPCMFAAWGCAWCSKLVSTERRARGEAACSDRCALGLRLEAEYQLTGARRAWCPVCERIRDAGAFHRETNNRNGLSSRCKDCQKDAYARNKIDYRRRRFAYEAANPSRVVPFTQQEQDARWAMWGGRCWLCGIADATEEDHVKPLSAGGWHCLANLRPACQPCNSSKQASWPLPTDRLRPNFRHPSPRPGSDADERTPREPRREHTCEHCGTVRLIPACYARAQRFCSAACKNAANTRPKITMICVGCSTPFELPGHQASKQRKFCTTTCAYTSGKRGKGGRRKSAPGTGQDLLW